MSKAGWAVAAMAAGAAFGGGSAQAVEELRIGLIAHNIQVINAKNANKEAGPDIEAQAVFGSGLLKGTGLHPYLLANVNTQGQTSYAAVGLEWQWRFAPKWRFEPGFGIAIHNGKLDNPYPNGTPQSMQFQDEHVLLGSRELFHTQIGVARDLTDRIAIEAVYEHLSNGQILHHGRNQGLDEAGVRLAFRFGD